jgi:hypothetical protein
VVLLLVIRIDRGLGVGSMVLLLLGTQGYDGSQGWFFVVSNVFLLHSMGKQKKS